MNLKEAMSQDMTGSYDDDILDSAIDPWDVPTEVRMPDVSTHNPLARLWQSEELDDYIEQRKHAFDTIDQHRCKRTQEAIVDGSRQRICDICSPAYGALGTVLEVQDTELKRWHRWNTGLNTNQKIEHAPTGCTIKTTVNTS